MPTFTPGLRAACAALIVAALASACDKPKPRPAANVSGPLNGTAAPAPPPAAPASKAATTTDPVPPAPQWAASYMGKAFKDIFPNSEGTCVGNTDVVNLRYQGAAPGVRVEGWAWDTAAKMPVRHVLLTDDAGKVVGAGETGVLRPDVIAARREVTSSKTGWYASTAQTSGGIYGYGILADGKTACRLGHVNL